MAAKPLTKCPNCSSKITNRFECRNCGLLFDRYFKAEARRKKEEKARAAKKVRTNQILGTIATLAAIVIIGGGSYYFFNQQSEEGSAPRATPLSASANHHGTKSETGICFTIAPRDNPTSRATQGRVQ